VAENITEHPLCGNQQLYVVVFTEEWFFNHRDLVKLPAGLSWQASWMYSLSKQACIMSSHTSKHHTAWQAYLMSQDVRGMTSQLTNHMWLSLCLGYQVST
jgi:hypothetical protein